MYIHINTSIKINIQYNELMSIKGKINFNKQLLLIYIILFFTSSFCENIFELFKNIRI